MVSRKLRNNPNPSTTVINERLDEVFTNNPRFTRKHTSTNDLTNTQTTVLTFFYNRLPHWVRYAACNPQTSHFFHDYDDETRTFIYEYEAKKLCNTCAVRKACLEMSLETQDVYNICGGLTPIERAQRHPEYFPGINPIVLSPEPANKKINHSPHNPTTTATSILDTSEAGVSPTITHSKRQHNRHYHRLKHPTPITYFEEPNHQLSLFASEEIVNLTKKNSQGKRKNNDTSTTT